MVRLLLTIWFVVLANFAANAQSIKPYNESASHFSTPPVIDTTRGKFEYKDMYRAFRKAGTGFTSMTKTQRKLESEIRSFAKKRKKSFIVLGSQLSHPPHILGNFPRMEIIYVLVD